MVLPSEGGHVIFPFKDEEEWAFSRFLQQRLCTDVLTGDDVLGGVGLATLYTYHSGKDLLPMQVGELFASEGEKTQALKVTLEWYARFFGRFCRNFILDVLPRNGLYITGGVAAYTGVLQHPSFLDTLHNSSTQQELLKKIPIFHVRNSRVGILGCACFAALVLSAQAEQEQTKKPQ